MGRRSCAATSTPAPTATSCGSCAACTTLGGRRTHFQDAWLRLPPTNPGRGDGPADGHHLVVATTTHTRPLRSLDLDRRIDYVLVTTRKKDGRGTVLRLPSGHADRA
jgi:hypothetical protein